MKWKLVTERAFNFPIPEWVTCGEFKYSEEYGLKKRKIKDILITSNTGINILFRENLWLSLNSVKEVFKCDDPKKFVNDDDNITIENAKLWVLNEYSFWKYDKYIENISFIPAEVPYITQVKKNGKEKWKLYGIIKKYPGEEYSNMNDLIEKCGDINQKWTKINESIEDDKMKWILISESIDIDQVKTYDQLIRWAKSTYKELYNKGYSDLDSCYEIARMLVRNGYGDMKFWEEKVRENSIWDDGGYSRVRDLMSGEIKKKYPRLNNLKKNSNDDEAKKVSKPKPSKISNAKTRRIIKPKKEVEPDDGEIRIPEIQEGTILCGTYKGSGITSLTYCKVTRRIGTSELKVVELMQSNVKGYDDVGWAKASKYRKDKRPYTLVIDKDNKIHKKGEENGIVFQVWDGEPKYFDTRISW